eukprot:scaffold14035_cov38-Tisochrysis_lutea.AAC.1
MGRKKASAAGSELEACTSSSGPLAWGDLMRSPPNSSRPSLYRTLLRRTKVGAWRQGKRI